MATSFTYTFKIKIILTKLPTTLLKSLLRLMPWAETEGVNWLGARGGSPGEKKRRGYLYMCMYIYIYVYMYVWTVYTQLRRACLRAGLLLFISCYVWTVYTQLRKACLFDGGSLPGETRGGNLPDEARGEVCRTKLAGEVAGRNSLIQIKPMFGTDRESTAWEDQKLILPLFNRTTPLPLSPNIGHASRKEFWRSPPNTGHASCKGA